MRNHFVRGAAALALSTLAAFAVARAEDPPKAPEGEKPAAPEKGETDRPPGEKDKATEETTYDWGVAYYMSYDNNLEGCGKIIIDGITEGVKSSPKTIAAVQADFTDKKGMRRTTIKSTGAEEAKVDTEDSANEDTAIEYLEWFVTKFKCKRYVVTFLNHGGRLDDMCADENPGPSRKQWMSGKVLGEKFRKLKDKFPGTWDLFFLQQCGRGSVENLYSFRGTANYIMSSPIPVGAPNTYYTAFHKWLGETPNATGDQVAARIMKEDDHYTIYTCLRTPKLDDLPGKLDAAIKPFVEKADLAPPERMPRVIHPVGEPIVDLKVYLDRLAKANGNDGASIAELTKWMKEELFTSVTFHAGREGMKSSLCGLSVYAPQTPAELSRYKKLEIYEKTKLMSLWEKLQKAGAAKKEAEKKPAKAARRDDD